MMTDDNGSLTQQITTTLTAAMKPPGARYHRRASALSRRLRLARLRRRSSLPRFLIT
jgi:hypothetical protein